MCYLFFKFNFEHFSLRTSRRLRHRTKPGLYIRLKQYEYYRCNLYAVKVCYSISQQYIFIYYYFFQFTVSANLFVLATPSGNLNYSFKIKGHYLLCSISMSSFFICVFIFFLQVIEHFVMCNIFY